MDVPFLAARGWLAVSTPAASARPCSLLGLGQSVWGGGGRCPQWAGQRHHKLQGPVLGTVALWLQTLGFGARIAMAGASSTLAKQAGPQFPHLYSEDTSPIHCKGHTLRCARTQQHRHSLLLCRVRAPHPKRPEIFPVWDFSGFRNICTYIMKYLVDGTQHKILFTFQYIPHTHTVKAVT